LEKNRGEEGRERLLVRRERDIRKRWNVGERKQSNK
jgi:hypothetical protein